MNDAPDPPLLSEDAGEDWDLPDPDGLSVTEVGPIRAETDRRVRRLLEELS